MARVPWRAQAGAAGAFLQPDVTSPLLVFAGAFVVLTLVGCALAVPALRGAGAGIP